VANSTMKNDLIRKRSKKD